MTNADKIASVAQRLANDTAALRIDLENALEPDDMIDAKAFAERLSNELTVLRTLIEQGIAEFEAGVR